MRREPIPKEYPVHIVRKGTRDLPFLRDDFDRWRNLRRLFFLNDVSAKEYWLRDTKAGDFRSPQTRKGSFFRWPDSWPERKPLIDIVAFTFNTNHDHIIAWEKEEKGVSRFMHKSGISISKHFNERYKEQGTVLKPYILRIIDSDRYLRWVVPYVMIKNTFEMHPKGYKWAVENFESAWNWALKYPFSSLADYTGERNSPVVNTTKLKEMIGGKEEFKKLCKEMLTIRKEMEKEKVGYIKYFAYE
jgi:hypothetical protein